MPYQEHPTLAAIDDCSAARSVIYGAAAVIAARLGPELTPALASELQIILDAADRMHAYHARIRHQLSSALKQDKGLLS